MAKQRKRPKQLSKEWIAEITRKSKQKSAARAARRRAQREKPLEAEDRVVAWIDILGFSEQLTDANTPKKLKDAYLRLLRVQSFFNLPSASDDPDEQTEQNKVYGREVLALSDGLVLTASLNSPTAQMMTPYDLLMSLFGEILEAQASCAINGIFIRGGISKGLFYFKDNILLSPPLVRAYKLENKKAVYPVILIDHEVVKDLRTHHGRKHYSKDAEPSLSYFRDFESPKKEKGDSLYFLDYLAHLSSTASHGWYKDEDRQAFITEKEPEKRQKILDESHIASSMRAMGWHKDAVVKAHDAATDSTVKAKYRWLMDYHNSAIEDIPGFDPVRIEPPSKEKT
jgi:hypothetical protein